MISPSFIFINIIIFANILISNAIIPFRLNNNLFDIFPYSTIGKIYKYDLLANCSINKQYLCNSLAIDSNVMISPYNCIISNNNLWLTINKTEYKLDHMLTPSNHIKSHDNWAILYLNESITKQTEIIKQSATSIVKSFDSAYTYRIGYDTIVNQTSLIVKVCNISNSKNMIEVKESNVIPKYYFAWNNLNHILYNKNNKSGEFMFDLRNYSDNTIKYHSICMISYLSNNYSTCISIPYLAYINEKHHNLTLNMTNYNKISIFHNLTANSSKFDNNCNLLPDSTSKTNTKTSSANLSKYTNIYQIMAIFLVYSISL
jgi:hypothetical protein